MPEQPNRVQAILDSLFAFVALLEPDGTIFEINRAPLSASGIARADVIGRNFALWWDFNPEAKKEVEEAMARAREGKACRFETRVCVTEGRLVPIDFHIGPLFDSEGRVEHLVASAVDISAQTAAEGQLRLLSKAFSSSSEAFIITDNQNNIVAVNDAFTRLTGYEAQEVLGKNPKILSSGHETREFYQEFWRALKEKGAWSGEIWDRRKNGEIYPKWLSINTLKDEEGKITHYIGSFSDISERKEAEDRIKYLAQHDILTGLPNRLLFSDRLSQAISNSRRNQGAFAVLSVDLDRFKTINDSLGHHIGDLLLQEIALRLKKSVRESDTVCRQGSDEFILLVGDSGSPELAALVAGKILLSLSRPLTIEGHEIELSPSIGIALFPGDGPDCEDLIKHADAAMYHAKQSGRGQYQFFTRKLNAQARERLQLENALKKAAARNELVLHYQPKLDLKSGRIIGAEALVRWQHPELGMIPPAKFIPLAEETGLVIGIGNWVLAEACRAGTRLQALGFKEFSIGVNVSALQLKENDFASRVRQTLADTGFDPLALELEVTESMIMHDVERVTRILHELNEMGLRLSVDDFGTGHSSLAYLKRFPIHSMKIDRSFVEDIMNDRDDAIIVNAIINLAHSLRLDVVAEGVETREQLDFLSANGCDTIQGYWLSKPLPEEAFRDFLLAHQRKR